jgi:hypothetical protein
VGAEGAGEVIDTAISYNRESAERGLLEETKSHVRLVTSSVRMTIKGCHQLAA